MAKYAVILGGGSGTRAGGSVPKQFREVAGRPLIWWSLRAFHLQDPETRLVMVVHPDWMGEWRRLFDALPAEDRIPHEVTPGGRDRVESVAGALSRIAGLGAGQGDLIAVHDGARCCVSGEVIARGWETAGRERTAVPVVAVTDSLRELLPTSGDKAASTEAYAPGGSRSVDRSRYVAVQTPQVFDAALLMDAFGHREPGRTYTDDASIVEPLCPIALYEGDAGNIKVTHPQDFVLAERSLLG